MADSAEIADAATTGLGFDPVTLRFLKPVFIGDTITAAVEITELVPEKYRVRLSTTCTNQDGVVVIEGEALLYFKVLEK